MTEDRPEGPTDTASGVVAPALRGLARRLGFERAASRRGYRVLLGGYVFVNCAISMIILTAAALLINEPFIFPSLGATAFILFFAAMSVQAAPKNVFCGQLIGLVSGVVGLAVFGLAGVASGVEVATWSRTGAVAVALGLSAALMVWLNIPHAPAAATAMTVALGVLQTPMHLLVFMVAVALLIGQAHIVNRLAGLPYPWWSPRKGAVVSDQS
ncbi:MAG: HPP family protein [Actinobacteria bacterium]|nr:HPP family protein [Actinomycetota bacterium]